MWLFNNTFHHFLNRYFYYISSMTLIAILLPWLSFMLRGRILTGILCLILQITLIGWIPAAIWAVISLQNAREDKRTRRIERAIRESRR